MAVCRQIQSSWAVFVRVPVQVLRPRDRLLSQACLLRRHPRTEYLKGPHGFQSHALSMGSSPFFTCPEKIHGNATGCSQSPASQVRQHQHQSGDSEDEMKDLNEGHLPAPVSGAGRSALEG
jgi:hypothetical protein